MSTSEDATPGFASQLIGAREASLDLSMLDGIGDRAGRGLRQIVADFGLPMPEVAAQSVKIESYGKWRQTLPACPGLCHLSMAPFKAGVLIALPAPLIAKMVDAFYGGTGNVRFDRDRFTGAEERTLNRVGELLADLISAVWSASGPLPAALLATATDDEAGFYPDDEQLALQSLTLGGPLFDGMTVEFLYPLSGLRGVKPAKGTALAEALPSDTVWQDKLIDAVLQVRLPLRTVFARADLPLNDLLDLQPGDLIPICLPNLIPVTVGDRRFAEATVGESNGRASIRIESIHKGPSHD